MSTRGVGYARVSGRGQLDGDGFDRQRTAIEKYARANGIHIVKWFEEKGVSGTTDAEERPAFQAMMSELLSNGCRTVIVEGLDRLAREYRIQEQLLIYIASKDIALIAANTGENVTDAIKGDPMKKALVQIQGVFAELDKNQLVTKLRKARQRVRQRDGKCEGPKFYGDHPQYPGEREIVERMKQMAAEGLNYTQIADVLNGEGVPTRLNGAWYPATVSRILQRAAQGQGAQ